MINSISPRFRKRDTSIKWKYKCYWNKQRYTNLQLTLVNNHKTDHEKLAEKRDWECITNITHFAKKLNVITNIN